MPFDDNVGVSAEMLPWDSEFFGFPVASISVGRRNFDPREIEMTVDRLGCKLAYLFVYGNADGDSNPGSRAFPACVVAKCYDVKTVYRKHLRANGCLTIPDGAVAATTITSEMENLAYESGWASRFMLDERLRPFFKPMYLKWLQNDFAMGKVFIRPSETNACGMATISVKDGFGKIGLVAVSAENRGHGYGTMLMNDVFVWLSTQNVNECEVVTQGANSHARRLYEKVGFKLTSQTEVWHIWR